MSDVSDVEYSIHSFSIFKMMTSSLQLIDFYRRGSVYNHEEAEKMETPYTEQKHRLLFYQSRKKVEFEMTRRDNNVTAKVHERLSLLN